MKGSYHFLLKGLEAKSILWKKSFSQRAESGRNQKKEATFTQANFAILFCGVVHCPLWNYWTQLILKVKGWIWLLLESTVLSISIVDHTPLHEIRLQSLHAEKLPPFFLVVAGLCTLRKNWFCPCRSTILETKHLFFFR